MSHDPSSNSDSTNAAVSSGDREVAHRLFAAEYTDATYSYSESDEERAPNYVVTPTGVRANRLFVAGVLTEVSPAGESMLRARVADPTGAFVVYAGQYQPDAMTFLDSVTPPVFVGVTGKARTFSPEDADVVYTSIRPEVITEVDSDTRDRWTVSTAQRTLERIATLTGALRTDRSGEELTTVLTDAGVDPGLAAGIPIVIEQYGTTEAYLADLQRLSLDALGLVAGEIDAVDELSRAPDQTETELSVTPVIDHDIPGAATAPERESEPTAEPQTGMERASETTVDESGFADQSEPAQDALNSAEAEPITDTEAESDSEEYTAEEFDPEEFELDAEVRNEVESEFGTEFSTAAEVDTSEEPSAPDIEEEPNVDTDTTVEEPTTTEPTGETVSETDDEPMETDVTSVLLETMRDLDDGDGVDRERLLDRVSETADASEKAVSEAIQDALMSGQCYEPDDDTLKPI